jgi:gamma-glutamylcyclotransferase (GGCT)/AIG2-like uncharacterized protein YtfP
MTREKSLFAYGSLMCDDIMLRVSGFEAKGEKATLAGFRRLSVKDEKYPALIPSAGYSVDGILYRDIPGDSWPRLDAFEGPMYLRQMHPLCLENGGTTTAFVYVLNPLYSHMAVLPEWSFEEFLRTGKECFIAHYRGYEALK